MALEIQEVGPDALERYSRISIAFDVRSTLRAVPKDGGLEGMQLVEDTLATPYVKDYDARRGEGPTRWRKRFDMSNWGIFIATDDGRDLGAATVAFNTPGVHMLKERNDLACLWDMRVEPGERGRGIGAALFQHAADWARLRGCRQLVIETQNTNVPACRFYAKQGCRLGCIDRYAYVARPDIAHEAMLLWYLDL